MVNNDTCALEVKSLAKSFGPIEVLKNIDVTAQSGEFLVLVGPSGCGKYTLLNCIAGLEETTSGGIFIKGNEVTNLAPRDRNIAMVFQSYALYPTMSVRENIAFGMKIRKIPAGEIATKTEAVAQLLQITPLLDRRPGQLSGGQRQRVAMGRALVRNPDLFLFDEPLSNLDAKLRVEMRAEIKHLHQTTGATIVYVTHDQIEAMTLATKIVILKDGIVQQVGTPADIYHNPANTFVADFMGSPPMNLIPASIQGTDCVQLADGQKIAGISLPKGAKSDIILGLRPEVFSPGSLITIHPTATEHTGSDTYLSFVLGDQPVIARLPWSFQATNSTDSIGLDIDLSQLRFFDPASGEAYT